MPDHALTFIYDSGYNLETCMISLMKCLFSLSHYTIPDRNLHDNKPNICSPLFRGLNLSGS